MLIYKNPRRYNITAIPPVEYAGPLHYDVVILGGGAAGLFCAIQAGRRGRKVLVLERAERTGKKILISGGGRCNFTNLRVRADNFLSRNPHFAKSALARYTPADFISLVNRHGIPWHEKTLGQLFCDRSASDITSLLERECAEAGVTVQTGVTVQEVSGTSPFLIRMSTAETHAAALVVATGGLSVPKMGATDFGYRLARQYGHSIVPCYPALVPFTFDAPWLRTWGELAGVSAETLACAASGPGFREKFLFTHRGLSGPAILQVSSYWKPGEAVTLDLAPGFNFAEHLRQRRAAGDRASFKTLLSGALPQRLAETWLEQFPAGTAPPRLDAALHRWELIPAGTEGYAKAEVTGGGVDTDQLSSKTMESRLVRGLYFIGEVVDVTGHLGGYKFQWAWASGYAAGQAV